MNAKQYKEQRDEYKASLQRLDGILQHVTGRPPEDEGRLVSAMAEIERTLGKK